jgi:hypothetical protein
MRDRNNDTGEQPDLVVRRLIRFYDALYTTINRLDDELRKEILFSIVDNISISYEMLINQLNNSVMEVIDTEKKALIQKEIESLTFRIMNLGTWKREK